MTARLGSEYRYFGKLVLVPFRYFSIDTYRNIDIFDNTTPYIHLHVSQFSNLSLYLCGATRPDKTLPTSTYTCHITQISLSLPVRSDQTGQYAPSTSTYTCHITQISLSLYLCGATRPDNTLRPHPPTGVTILKSLSLSTCAERPDRTIRSVHIHLQVSHSSNLSLSLPVRSDQTGQYAPSTSTYRCHNSQISLSLYLCGATRPDNTLRPHPPTGVTFLKSLSLSTCAERPDRTIRSVHIHLQVSQFSNLSLSLPVRSDQTGQYAPSTSTYRCHNSQISLSLPVRSDQTRQSTDACIKYCTHETHLFHLYLQLFE